MNRGREENSPLYPLARRMSHAFCHVLDKYGRLAPVVRTETRLITMYRMPPLETDSYY